MPKKALGKGLEALLPSRRPPEDASTIAEIDIELITPNPQQPRKEFDPQRLTDLAESIKRSGILQPIVVRRDDQRYIIIVGERRWRAARLAGKKTIPAIVKQINDSDFLPLALIENIQRENLNPIELANAFNSILAAGVTQEQLAKQIGKDRSHIANTVRLLRLPPDVQNALASEKLSAGHARALLTLQSAEQQSEVAKNIIAESWSVRKTEKLVKSGSLRKKSKKKSVSGKDAARSTPADPHIEHAREAMMRYLSTRVSITNQARGGYITISFFDEEDLSRIIDLIIH